LQLANASAYTRRFRRKKVFINLILAVEKCDHCGQGFSGKERRQRDQEHPGVNVIKYFLFVPGAPGK
jgi:hypothetical protein